MAQLARQRAPPGRLPAGKESGPPRRPETPRPRRLPAGPGRGVASPLPPHQPYGCRDGHLQRLRGEQGRRARLPAGPLRAAGRGREDLQLPAGPGAARARRARARGLRAARRHPRGPRRPGHQRRRRERPPDRRREGRAGVPGQRGQLPGGHPLRPRAALLQREADAGLHVPLALRHRVAALPRAGQLRHRGAGDGHLQAALLPDADRDEVRGAGRPAAVRHRGPPAQDLRDLLGLRPEKPLLLSGDAHQM